MGSFDQTCNQSKSGKGKDSLKAFINYILSINKQQYILQPNSYSEKKLEDIWF